MTKENLVYSGPSGSAILVSGLDRLKRPGPNLANFPGKQSRYSRFDRDGLNRVIANLFIVDHSYDQFTPGMTFFQIPDCVRDCTQRITLFDYR